MKKSILYTGLAYVGVGLVCLALAIWTETRLDGLLWGLAGAGTLPGIKMIWLYFHWTQPEHQAEYAQRQQAQRIAQKDERLAMLRDRSGRTAYQLMIGLYCALILVFSICSMMGWWMPFARSAVLLMAALLMVQVATRWVTFARLVNRE